MFSFRFTFWNLQLSNTLYDYEIIGLSTAFDCWAGLWNIKIKWVHADFWRVPFTRLWEESRAAIAARYLSFLSRNIETFLCSSCEEHGYIFNLLLRLLQNLVLFAYVWSIFIHNLIDYMVKFYLTNLSTFLFPQYLDIIFEMVSDGTVTICLYSAVPD